MMLRFALRAQLKRRSFWIFLALLVVLALAVRGERGEAGTESYAQVGVALPAEGGETFWQSVDARDTAVIEFVRTDAETLRANVAAGRWDCGLLLPSDFDERLEDGDYDRLITVVSAPGSALYPLVEEAAAAALMEMIAPRIAADYMLLRGLGGVSTEREALALAGERMSDPKHVLIQMETLEQQPLEKLLLIARERDRLLRGGVAILLLVWMLSAAVDMGRWRCRPEIRRMLPCRGRAVLLPQMLSFALPAFCAGALCLAAAADGARSAWMLLPYLALCGALAIFFSGFSRMLSILPALIPLIAVAGLVLSPVIVDVSVLFPRLAPLTEQLPVTLYLNGSTGEASAVVKLLAAAVLIFMLSRPITE